MDPNATLTEIRATLAEITSQEGDTWDLDEYLIQTERLAETIQALDEWLSKGGFLPTAWER